MKFPHIPVINPRPKVLQYELTDAGRKAMRTYGLEPIETRTLWALNEGPATSYMLATRVQINRDALKPVVENLYRHGYIQQAA